jgi:hypothetical protein
LPGILCKIDYYIINIHVVNLIKYRIQYHWNKRSGFNNTIIVQVRYIIIETNEFSHIGYNRILFPHLYSGDGLGAMHLGLHLSTHAEKKPVNISRSFKCRKSSPVVCLICYYLRSVGSLVVFVLREYILKVHIHVSSISFTLLFE